jgi:hypothetical protein
VVVGTDRVVVVVVVVVVLVVVVVVVLLSVDDFVVVVVVFDDGVVEDGDDALVPAWLALCGWLGTCAVARGVPSVATCSSRTGGNSAGCFVVMPAVNNATAVAPRNAPTANRNGAPCWSSTRYVYLLNPFGSSRTKLSTKSKRLQPTPGAPPSVLRTYIRRSRLREVWGVAPQNNGERAGPRFPRTHVPRASG